MPSTSTDRLSGLSTSVAVKAPVKAVSTASLTLSGLQTVGGVELYAGDRVLVKDQSDATENGIYVAGTGSWERAKDFDGNRDVVQGTLIVANFGNGEGLLYRVTTADPIVFGESEIAIVSFVDPNQTYPQTESEADNDITPTSYAYPPGNLFRYGAVGNGSTDDAAALQAAIDALPTEGGEVLVPEGDFVIASTIDLEDRRSIRIYGVSKPTGGALTASILRCTQTTGSRIFNARTTAGVLFDSLMIRQTGVGFTGHVIDYDHSATASDSAFGGVRDCLIDGETTAASLVHLKKSICMSVIGNHLIGGTCAILGGGTASYANAISVTNNLFIGQGTAAIVDPGEISQAWFVNCNAFEPKADGTAGAIYTTARMTNITFTGNWLGDANATGSWISCGAMDGCVIQGNLISTGAKGIEVTGALNNVGNTVTGNTFATLTTALDISTPLTWSGNYESNFFFTVTNSILGSVANGRSQNDSQTTHTGSQLFSNAVPNGVGGAISSVIWSILTGGASNIGLVVKGHSGQLAYLGEFRDSSDNVLLGISEGGHLQFREVADPSAPASDFGFLYMKDNGSGKTQLVARFPTGAIQVIATEP